MTSNSPEGYYLYLSLYPAGSFVDEAVSALAGLDALDARGVTAETVNQGRNQGGGRGFLGQSDTSDTTGRGGATNQGRQESQRQSGPGLY